MKTRKPKIVVKVIILYKYFLNFEEIVRKVELSSNIFQAGPACTNELNSYLEKGNQVMYVCMRAPI